MRARNSLSRSREAGELVQRLAERAGRLCPAWTTRASRPGRSCLLAQRTPECDAPSTTRSRTRAMTCWLRCRQERLQAGDPQRLVDRQLGLDERGELARAASATLRRDILRGREYLALPPAGSGQAAALDQLQWVSAWRNSDSIAASRVSRSMTRGARAGVVVRPCRRSAASAHPRDMQHLFQRGLASEHLGQPVVVEHGHHAALDRHGLHSALSSGPLQRCTGAPPRSSPAAR